MPKGVMWRHEDIFYGGDGRRRAGRRQADSPRPEEIAERVPERAARVHVPGVPADARHRALDGLRTAVHWRRGDRPRRARLDPVAVVELVAARDVNSLSIVGDAFGATDARRAGRRRTRRDVSPLRGVRSRAARSSRRREARAASIASPTSLIVDGSASSETGARASRSWCRGGEPERSAGSPRDRRHGVLDDRSSGRAGVGAIGTLARRGHDPARLLQGPRRRPRRRSR